jgi:hypothetical protein
MEIELPAGEVIRASIAAGLSRSAWHLRIQPEEIRPWLLELGEHRAEIEAAAGAPLWVKEWEDRDGIQEVNSTRWRWEGDPGQIQVTLAAPGDRRQPLLELVDGTREVVRRWVDSPVPVPAIALTLATALAADRMRAPVPPGGRSG